MSIDAKLKWHCRRGTKELDFLLERYLNNHHQQASMEEQSLFIELLSLQDDQLILFMLGDNETKPERLAKLVKKIRNYSDL